MKRLLLLGLAACGFSPEESFTGRRIGDGVSPWRDLGAVQICLGNQRIGPAGSDVGGLCFPADAPAEASCAADADCRSREVCACGRCTLKYCSVASECGVGRGCVFSERRCLPTCIEDDDCGGEGEICAGGFCKGRCAGPADCQTGEVCSGSGFCNVATCSQASPCGTGQTCREQRVPRATAEPSPLAEAGGIVLYLEMEGDIWRGVSADGVSFRLDPAQPVLVGARAPSIVRSASTYRLYVETDTGIFVAEGDDGRTFGPPALAIPGDFHAPGAAVDPSGQPIVYLAQGERAGLALWQGGGTPQPVLTLGDIADPELWRNVDRLGSPSILIETSPLGEPAVHIWFDAFGQESKDAIQFGVPTPIPPNDSVGFASTLLAAPASLVRYPYNPVFDRVEALLDHRGERAPAVVRLPDGERYLLYYQASSADETQAEGIGVAVNPAE